MAAIDRAVTFRDPEGHAVCGILAAPPEGTDRLVVLCHGFLSHKNSTTNRTLTAQLVEQGIATFRFDFFGQGESEGPFERITVTTAIGQALAALDLVASKGYRRLGLIGSSFGGLVAVQAAAQWSHPPAPGAPGGAPLHSYPPAPGAPGRAPSRATLVCLGLKCPVPDFPEELQLELGEAGIAEWKATGTVPDFRGGPDRMALSYAFYEDCTRYCGYTAAKAITAPTLIVQGAKDESVPLHQSRRLFDALQTEKRLAILPGADHRFTSPEDFRSMTGLLVGWMTGHLRPRNTH